MNEGVTIRPNGELASLAGHDAMRWMQVQTIARGLAMYDATGGKMILTRGATPKRLLSMASGYTGQSYKNNAKDRSRAVADLKEWAGLMASALPVTVQP